MIIVSEQEILSKWLSDRIGYKPNLGLQCIGNASSDGKILGVAGYDSWNGASCNIHIAGEGNNWLSRAFLHIMFDYPFNRENVKVLICKISSQNKKSIKFAKHIGFEEVGVIENGAIDGNLVIMQLQRENCRFLDKKYNHEIRIAPSDFLKNTSRNA